MAKIKRQNAKLVSGLTADMSGSIQIVEFTREGVVRGLSQPIHIKRPNQYKR